MKNKTDYSYEEIVHLCYSLFSDLKVSNFIPQKILVIPNGSLVISRIMIELFNDYIERDSCIIKKWVVEPIFLGPDAMLKKDWRVLVLDEICDSGKTLQEIYDAYKPSFERGNYKSAVLHLRKKGARNSAKRKITPNFFVEVLDHDEYINYPWEYKILEDIICGCKI